MPISKIDGSVLFRILIYLFGMTFFDLQIYPNEGSRWDCKGFDIRIFNIQIGWNNKSGWWHENCIFIQDPYLWITIEFCYYSIFDLALVAPDVDFSSVSFLGKFYTWNEDLDY